MCGTRQSVHRYVVWRQHPAIIRPHSNISLSTKYTACVYFYESICYIYDGVYSFNDNLYTILFISSMIRYKYIVNFSLCSLKCEIYSCVLSLINVMLRLVNSSSLSKLISIFIIIFFHRDFLQCTEYFFFLFPCLP